MKKVTKPGTKNSNPNAYFITVRNLRMLDENLILKQCVKDNVCDVSLIRQYDFELNLVDIPLPDPIVVTDNMDAQQTASRIAKVCFQQKFDREKFNCSIMMCKMRGPEIKMEPTSLVLRVTRRG